MYALSSTLKNCTGTHRAMGVKINKRYEYWEKIISGDDIIYKIFLSVISIVKGIGM